MGKRILIPVLALVGLGWAWAWASPVGSSPDEAFHLTSSWCAWGAHETCVIEESGTTVEVPRQVGELACFLEGGQVSATCIDKIPFEEGIRTANLNPATGSYPPLFHAVMRVFVGSDVERSVLSMRMFNVLLAAAFLGAALVVASPIARRALAISWALAMVPLGLYLIASVNPSGWALIAGGTFWVFALTLVEERTLKTRRARLALTGALLAAGVGLLSRSDQAVTLIASSLAVLVIGQLGMRRRTFILVFTLMATAVIAVALRFRVGSYLESRGFTWPAGDSLTNQPNPAVRLLTEIPAYLAGHFGFQPNWEPLSEANFGVPGWVNRSFVYGLGSYEVPLPSAVSVLTLLVLGILIAVGLSYLDWRKIIAISIVLGGLLALILTQRSLAGWGSWEESTSIFYWYLHPRYTLPLLIVALGLSLIVIPASRRLFNRAQAAFIVLALISSTTISFLALVTRYSLGSDAGWMTLSWNGGWWWAAGPSQLALFAVCLVAGSVFFTYTVWFGLHAEESSNLPKPANQENPSSQHRSD